MTEISSDSPVHRKWADVRRTVSWDRSDDELMSAFGRYVAVQTKQAEAEVVVLPVGQHRSLGSGHADGLILVVTGEVLAERGSQEAVLTQYDLLSLDSHEPTKITNLGFEQAVFLCERSRDPRVDHAGAEIRPAGLAALAWKANRRRFAWRTPLAEQIGFHRHSGPLFYSPSLTCHMVGILPGQTTPWHEVPGETAIFFHLEGEVEFSCAGQTWALAPFDFFTIPGGMPYIYTNVGFDHALFFHTFPTIPPGVTNVYYSEDPGWPVRPDALVLKTTYRPGEGTAGG